MVNVVIYITFIFLCASDVLSKLYHGFHSLWMIDDIALTGATLSIAAQPTMPIPTFSCMPRYCATVQRHNTGGSMKKLEISITYFFVAQSLLNRLPPHVTA